LAQIDIAQTSLFSSNTLTTHTQATHAEGRSYSYWRRRIMLSIMAGYAAFYLVRQNFTMAIPYLQSELGYTKAEIGMIVSTGAIIYGLGKGLAGLLGDRSNARFLMSAGLLASAILSFFIGFSTTWTMLLHKHVFSINGMAPLCAVINPLV
jgi:sugar phosphate permease